MVPYVFPGRIAEVGVESLHIVAPMLSVPIDDEDRLRRVLAACIRPSRRNAKAEGSFLANLLSRVPRAQSPTEQLRT